ncbi:hypothetical protein OIU78_015580 [Salix suchowensis]|nr:hypothetical protein OIU78_015580 [Salix suchowensis]
MGPEPERSVESQPEPAASLHISRQRSTNKSGAVPFTFYPTGPPVPFVAMLPLYNFPNETGTSGASTNQFHGEEGHDNSDSGQGFETSEGLDHSELGRLCQNTLNPAPVVCPSPIMVPPVYLQHRFTWDGPGRPFSNNMNLLTQFMGYEPRSVPGAPLQSASNRPAGVYQHYVDEMPRYYGGTGTYLPNPKVSVRDRHTANMRKGNYNYNRNDQHGYMEGNWNNTSRARTSQNGPIHTNSAQNGSANVAYGIYLLPSLNPGGLSSKGPTISSDVMLYPSDHNTGYGSAEHLEFGSHRAGNLTLSAKSLARQNQQL